MDAVVIDVVDAAALDNGDWIKYNGMNLRIVATHDFGDEITFDCITETEDEESVTVPWNEKIEVLGWQ